MSICCVISHKDLCAQSSMIDQLEDQLKGDISDSTRVMIFSELGREYTYVSPTKALDYALKAKELATMTGERLGRAHALRTLASVNLILGNYVITNELLVEAIEIFESLGNKHGLGNCYISQAVAHHRQNELKEANELQFKALEIFKSIDLPERMSICFNNIGETYMKMGNTQQAIQYLDSSLRINIRLVNQPVMMSNYKNLGIIHGELKQDALSLKYLDLVLKLSDLLGPRSNSNAKCEALLALGQYHVEKDRKASINYYEMALELAETNGYDQYTSQAYLGLYECYKSYDLTLAEQFLQNYIQLKDSILNRSVEQRSQAMSAVYESRARELEIENLNNQRSLQEEVISNQQTLLALLLLLVLGAVYFLIVLSQNNKRKVKTNQLLRKKNQEIIHQNRRILNQRTELSKNKERLREAQLVARLGGWEYDVKNDVLEWYDETLDVFSKVSEKTPTPQEYLEAIHPDDRGRFMDSQNLLIKEQKPYKETTRVKTLDGGFMHVQINARPMVENGRVKKILGVSLDVTELIEYQKKLEQIVLKKDVILGVVAHDLRAPLNNILGLISAIDPNPDKMTEEDLSLFELVAVATYRGLDLINQLLEMSEVRDDQFNLQLEEMDVAQFVKSVANRLKLATNDTRLILTLPDQELNARIDVNRLTRVMDNLLSNARKFTKEDGEINVTVGANKGKAVIEVADSGIGIPKELHDVIFNRFSDARRTGLKGEKSTGLGMSIVKRIVDLHKGKISFESEEGKGTTFRIALPLI